MSSNIFLLAIRLTTLKSRHVFMCLCMFYENVNMRDITIREKERVKRITRRMRG